MDWEELGIRARPDTSVERVRKDMLWDVLKHAVDGDVIHFNLESLFVGRIESHQARVGVMRGGGFGHEKWNF